MSDSAPDMLRLLTHLLRASRASRALLLLGTFVLGGALHGLHHLQDPGCIDGTEHNGHACTVCSGLHGSTLAAAETKTPAPRLTTWLSLASVPALAPCSRPRTAAAPRAPPLG